jgi:hypothetical protein
MLTLRDKLSHLNYLQACKYLGHDGERLIRAGGQEEIDLAEQVSLSGDLFRLQIKGAVVTMRLSPPSPTSSLSMQPLPNDM